MFENLCKSYSKRKVVDNVSIKVNTSLVQKSILVSDIKIKGNITEKEDLMVDGEVLGNINASSVETFENSNIKGNITSKNSTISGKLKGDINADKVHITKTADVEGTIKQKTLSIEEGSSLKIKTETKKN